MGLQWIGRALSGAVGGFATGGFGGALAGGLAGALAPGSGAGSIPANDVGGDLVGGIAHALDPVQGSRGSSGITGLLGTLLGGFINQNANDNAADDTYARYLEERDYNFAHRGTDFAKLRRDAARAGFNPLTALAATGGAGYQTNASGYPALASNTAIGDAVNQGVGGLAADMHDIELARLQHVQDLDLQRQALGSMASVGSGFQSPVPTNSAVTTDNKGVVRLFDTSTGTWKEVSRRVANAIGAEDGDIITADMYAQIYGGTLGEVYGAKTGVRGEYGPLDKPVPLIGPVPLRGTPESTPGTVSNIPPVFTGEPAPFAPSIGGW